MQFYWLYFKYKNKTINIFSKLHVDGFCFKFNDIMIERKICQINPKLVPRRCNRGSAPNRFAEKIESTSLPLNNSFLNLHVPFIQLRIAKTGSCEPKIYEFDIDAVIGNFISIPNAHIRIRVHALAWAHTHK